MVNYVTGRPDMTSAVHNGRKTVNQMYCFKVSVKAEATVGNQLRRDSDGRGTEYVISPRRSLTFAYKEGPGTCRNEKIPNPYNINCRTMPDLCQVSTGMYAL